MAYIYPSSAQTMSRGDSNPVSGGDPNPVYPLELLAARYALPASSDCHFWESLVGTRAPSVAGESLYGRMVLVCCCGDPDQARSPFGKKLPRAPKSLCFPGPAAEQSRSHLGFQSIRRPGNTRAVLCALLRRHPSLRGRAPRATRGHQTPFDFRLNTIPRYIFIV